MLVDVCFTLVYINNMHCMFIINEVVFAFCFQYGVA